MDATDSDLSPLPATPTGLYRHYKGGEYEVLGAVRHSETLEPLVLYRALYGERGLWVRPWAMFFGDVLVAGSTRRRFDPVEPSRHNAPSTAGGPLQPIHSRAVADKFAAYPPAVRHRLLELREMILQTAATTPGVGTIEETLKWGEPAYLTSETGVGSTIRIDWKPKRPGEFALYFNCKTDLVERFRTMFPKDFRFEGQRALVFGLDAPLPRDALEFCIAAALTYHRKPNNNHVAGRAAQPPE